MPVKDTLGIKAEKALKEAVRELFEERAREGRPVVIWQNGKVIRVSAREIMNKEESTRG
jgi:hypothetical protein